jgi:hypothetical protein
MRVLDQPNGPGTQWTHVQAAAESVSGLAAINAGFFTPQGKPLGVVIANGKKAGSNNPSSLGAGVWYEAHGKTAIIRRERCNFNAPHLMQAGPFLAEKSSAVKGLDAAKTSAPHHAHCLNWQTPSPALAPQVSRSKLHSISMVDVPLKCLCLIKSRAVGSSIGPFGIILCVTF